MVTIIQGSNISLHVLLSFQEVLLASSASILDEAVEDGYWDSTISSPTLQLLDGVIRSYGSPVGDVINSEEIGDDAASK